jgi:hypothetical protein
VTRILANFPLSVPEISFAKVRFAAGDRHAADGAMPMPAGIFFLTVGQPIHDPVSERKR